MVFLSQVWANLNEEKISLEQNIRDIESIVSTVKKIIENCSAIGGNYASDRNHFQPAVVAGFGTNRYCLVATARRSWNDGHGWIRDSSLSLWRKIWLPTTRDVQMGSKLLRFERNLNQKWKKENIKIFNQWWKVSRLVFLHCAAVVSVDHGFAFESRRLLYEVFKRFGAKVS